MGAQPPNFNAPPPPPENQKIAIACEPVELETSFNNQKLQKWWFLIYV